MDINKILNDYEMMEELAEELDNLEIDDDEKLAKVLNGELAIPESKTRIAHNLSVEVESEREVINDASSKVTSNRKFPSEINNNDLITQNNQEIVDLLKTYRCKIKEVLKNVKKDDERNINLFLDLIDLKDDIEDDIRKMNEEEEYSDTDDRESDDEESARVELKQEETKRKVRFSKSLENVKLIDSKLELYESGDSSNNTIQIHFKHSDAKFMIPSLPDDDTIASPADIYKKFHINPKPLAFSPATKSILKNKGKEMRSPTIEDEKPIKKVFHSDFQVIGDVIEHKKEPSFQEDVVHIMAKDDAPKKISKFKQMRMKS